MFGVCFSLFLIDDDDAEITGLKKRLFIGEAVKDGFVHELFFISLVQHNNGPLLTNSALLI